jgi:hypothetical protein
VAATEASLALGVMEVLDAGDAAAVQKAAEQDYALLLRQYGSQEELRVGAPVVCFEEEKRTQFGMALS